MPCNFKKKNFFFLPGERRYRRRRRQTERDGERDGDSDGASEIERATDGEGDRYYTVLLLWLAKVLCPARRLSAGNNAFRSGNGRPVF